MKKSITVGDWVLKRKPNAEASGKLQSKWEGPFLVIKSNRSGHITCPTPKAMSCCILGMRTALKSTTYKLVKMPHRETISDRGPSQLFSVPFTLQKGHTLFLTRGNSTPEVRFLTRRTHCKLFQCNESPPKTKCHLRLSSPNGKLRQASTCCTKQ